MSFTAQMRAAGASAILATGLAAAAPARAVTLTDSFQVRATVIAACDLRLDPARRVAVRGGARLDLSPKELAVLECLLTAGGRPVSAEELLERAWDEAADPFTTTVKTTVRRLRVKLGDPPLIHTVREAGYRIGAE